MVLCESEVRAHLGIFTIQYPKSSTSQPLGGLVENLTPLASQHPMSAVTPRGFQLMITPIYTSMVGEISRNSIMPIWHFLVTLTSGELCLDDIGRRTLPRDKLVQYLESKELQEILSKRYLEDSRQHYVWKVFIEEQPEGACDATQPCNISIVVGEPKLVDSVTIDMIKVPAVS